MVLSGNFYMGQANLPGPKQILPGPGPAWPGCGYATACNNSYITLSFILLTCAKFKVWMTIVEWVECMGVASGCG